MVNEMMLCTCALIVFSNSSLIRKFREKTRFPVSEIDSDLKSNVTIKNGFSLYLVKRDMATAKVSFQNLESLYTSSISPTAFGSEWCVDAGNV
ncbi:hypothetical protein HNY73_017596 [Argiope bruennichi]|uniref:Uncharacterized protein n=1 Tax=Argiope bruennichi TaxID=94029 RepID=A0A8T0EB69_ARGBR|nr:hypothetical protein HNY73_017596 [Argiope bruennichi]